MLDDMYGQRLAGLLLKVDEPLHAQQLVATNRCEHVEEVGQGPGPDWMGLAQAEASQIVAMVTVPMVTNGLGRPKPV